MKTRKKVKVLVLMGGPSSEYEVSLETAKNVIAYLNPRKYLVRPALVSKTGKWLIGPSFRPPITAAGVATAKSLLLLKSVDFLNQTTYRPDVAFIAMHGTFGEDGRIQAILETLGIPYTGSGVMASALGMDKLRSSMIFRDAGLLVPEFFVITAKDLGNKNLVVKITRKLSWPLVVKPPNHGSSVGVSIVKTKSGLGRAAKEALKYSNQIILQKFIKGREITCGVLEGGDGKFIPLAPTEIVPLAGAFYDYQSKYADGGSRHIIPPRKLSPKIIKQIQDAAVTSHRAIGCSGMSRSDFVLGENGKLYILEINTIPGMTVTSLLPEAAKAVGIGFSKLIDLLIQNAIAKKGGA